MAFNLTIFPPDAQCFSAFAADSCPITNDMVSYLNLTTDFKSYFQAYCSDPPGDDGCPYGYCPNSDISGPLVRLSAYLTNFFVAILIFYRPDELGESFWSQVLTVYSLLITCVVSIIQHQITQIHAILAAATAGSPLSLYIAIYAIRSIWSDGHRLAIVLGPGRAISRIIVLTALIIWICLVIYVLLPSHLSHFTQSSCERGPLSLLIKHFFSLPILIFEEVSPLVQWVVLLPVQLTLLAWIIAVGLRRREIWFKGQNFTFRVWNTWRVICDNYPFVQFTTIVFIPFAYWTITIETAIVLTNDDHFSATFGQVLAMFVTLPPMIQVGKLVPRLLRWFTGLVWVRFFTRCLQLRNVHSSMDVPPDVTSATPQLAYGIQNRSQFQLGVASDERDKEGSVLRA